MSNLTMTLVGLYNYDDTLFDGLTVPSDLDHDTAVFSILEECGFLQVLFPNPEYLKASIAVWAAGMSKRWDRYYAAISTTYSPLHNYDMTESVMEHIADSQSTAEMGTNTGTVTNAKTAFDTDTFANTDQRTDNLADSRSVTGSGSSDRTLSTLRSGNIGVTSSQQLLEAELDLTERLNIYQVITDDFKRKFCVLVY